MNPKGRGTRWKAVKLDYEVLQLYDDKGLCTICLTQRQAAALLGYARGMEWRTRWDNLPPEFELQNWVSDIEGKLINVSCGNDELTRCLCDIAALLRQQIALNTAPTIIEIPPDNPGANLPGLNPPVGVAIAEQRYQASLCEASKIGVSTIFEMIYLSQQEACNEQASANDIDFTAIAALAAAAAFAAPIAVPVAATTAISAGMGFTALGIADAIFDFNSIEPAPPGCPPGRPPLQLQQHYECQLFQQVRAGINFETWRSAYQCANPAAIAYLQNVEGLTLADAQVVDANTRFILSEMMRNPEVYQGLIQLLSTLSDSPYIDPDICANCIGCNAVVAIQTWTDPRIIDITPAPASQESASRWTWDCEVEVTVTLDDVYCLTAFDAALIRNATSSSPGRVNVEVANKLFSDTSGGFGEGNINIQVPNIPTKSFSFVSTAGPFLRLDLSGNKGIRISPPNSYIDCT